MTNDPIAYPGTIDPISDPFGAAEASASLLRKLTGVETHHCAVVLGSGWKPAADLIGDVVCEHPMEALGGVPASTVPGHGGTFRSIAVGERRVLCFTGRVHAYEGHHPSVVVHAVRSAVLAGCRTVVLTNACGGVRPSFQPGQPVLISDHINLTGLSPLTGPNRDDLGPRFLNMVDAWSPRLRTLAHQVDPDLEEGVYCGWAGPCYETPAEIRYASAIGADLVGMSTVLEAVAARHLGAELLGFSLVTNLAAGLPGAVLDHEDVLANAKAVADRMGPLIAQVVRNI